jgi:hypothetical protein
MDKDEGAFLRLAALITLTQWQISKDPKRLPAASRYLAAYPLLAVIIIKGFEQREDSIRPPPLQTFDLLGNGKNKTDWRRIRILR